MGFLFAFQPHHDQNLPKYMSHDLDSNRQRAVYSQRCPGLKVEVFSQGEAECVLRTVLMDLFLGTIQQHWLKAYFLSTSARTGCGESSF
jgi:hypothetical protein